MASLKTLSPTMGKVLKCWWPHDEQPNQPGPKWRPVFFWGTAYIDGKKFYAVAYGTTQISERKEAKNGGDVFVPAQVGDSFRRHDGRYDFNDIKLIPATAEFFVQDRVGDRVEMGDFPFSLYPQVRFAMERASVPKRLKALNVVV
ncbi:hypothetical protein [Noviherbaspirillum pedocola]|uniref:Uncharacterized protein n=1 Tax=Noviherbaspirillum pedocola TaxID=2801341 RepID=A0A934W6A0_9BURK|nr:hypothetical protein [Noviherbaspirillum pedocola]MBK4735957.1 hypothetical protein [Noviherbaspirillum pedocola]